MILYVVAMDRHFAAEVGVFVVIESSMKQDPQGYGNEELDVVVW